MASEIRAIRRVLIAVADKYGFDSITMGEGQGTRPQWGHTPAPMLVLSAQGCSLLIAYPVFVYARGPGAAFNDLRPKTGAPAAIRAVSL